MGVELLKPGAHRNPKHHPPMNPALATPLYVLGGVLFVLFIGRAIIRLRHRLRLKHALENYDQSQFVRNSRLSAFVKKHILYAPLLSTRHSREFRLMDTFHMGVVPLRLEAVLLLGYITLNLVFFFALIDWWAGYGEMMYQLKYAGGHLAVMNSPALVLTAGRNNPLIWLLGLPFDTFNLMHRWIGRLMVAGGILHVTCVVVGQNQTSETSCDRRDVSTAKIQQKAWPKLHILFGIPHSSLPG